MLAHGQGSFYTAHSTAYGNAPPFQHSAPTELHNLLQVAQRPNVLNKAGMWELARFLWAYATVDHIDEGLFAASAEVLMASRELVNGNPELTQLNAGAVAHIAWAYASVGHHDPTLFAALGSRALWIKGKLRPGDLASLSWAFGTAQYQDKVVWEGLMSAAKPRLREFDPKQLANLCWGLAAADMHDATLMHAVCRLVVDGGLQGCSPHDAACLAWALAALRHLPRDALHAFEQHFNSQVQQYTAKDACLLLWAVTWSDPRLGPAIEHSSSTCRTGQIKSEGQPPRNQDKEQDRHTVASAVVCQQEGLPQANRLSSLYAMISVAYSDLTAIDDPSDLANLAWGISAVGLAVAGLANSTGGCESSGASNTSIGTASAVSGAEVHIGVHIDQQRVMVTTGSISDALVSVYECVTDWGAGAFSALDAQQLYHSAMYMSAVRDSNSATGPVSEGRCLAGQYKQILPKRLLAAGERSAASADTLVWCASCLLYYTHP